MQHNKILEEPQQLFLYLIEQGENTNYDTYDSAVVVAASLEEAQQTYPSSFGWGGGAWANSPNKVKVTYLGIAKEELTKGVVCAFFNAG